jgi:hypothetical protein
MLTSLDTRRKSPVGKLVQTLAKGLPQHYETNEEKMVAASNC